jgi:hypothetical protein
MASNDRLEKLTRAELVGMLLAYNHWYKRSKCEDTRRFLKARIEKIKKILEEK